jgi:hypothetical protein
MTLTIWNFLLNTLQSTWFPNTNNYGSVSRVAPPELRFGSTRSFPPRIAPREYAVLFENTAGSFNPAAPRRSAAFFPELTKKSRFKLPVFSKQELYISPVPAPFPKLPRRNLTGISANHPLRPLKTPTGKLPDPLSDKLEDTGKICFTAYYIHFLSRF